MIKITKQFEVEMAHLVRDAYSKRCAYSMHGHSYKIDITFALPAHLELNKGGMVCDFGVIKDFIFPFIDRYDHAAYLWDQEPYELKEFFIENFERVIIGPLNSSCENLSKIFFSIVAAKLKELQECDDQYPSYIADVYVSEVTVHETRTGKATCDTDYKIDIDGIYYNEFQYDDRYAVKQTPPLGESLPEAVYETQQTGFISSFTGEPQILTHKEDGDTFLNTVDRILTSTPPLTGHTTLAPSLSTGVMTLSGNYKLEDTHYKYGYWLHDPYYSPCTDNSITSGNVTEEPVNLGDSIIPAECEYCEAIPRKYTAEEVSRALDMILGKPPKNTLY